MKEIATYDYSDDEGKLLYQNVRYKPKDFRMRRPDGNGGWIWGLDNIKRTLYRLPSVIKAKSIIYVEGEKDVHSIEKLGLVATTAGSAGSWNDSFAEHFKGRRVAVICDNDEVGHKESQKVASSVHNKAEVVKIVHLPVAEGGDVSNWQENGGSKEQLVELIKNAPEYKPTVIVEEPDPLRRIIPYPEPYPIEVLPPVLRHVVERTVDIYQCPPALAGQSFAGSATLAVQGHADIKIDGRIIPLCEYFITVGESGERKSAIDKLALQPIHEHQKKLHDNYTLQFVEWDARQRIWKQQRDSILKKKKPDIAKSELIELGPEPPPPLEPMMTCEEPTYEAIQKTLHRGQPSLGLFSDEGGRFIGGFAMNADNRLKTSAGLSNLWDGKPITRTRASDGNITLYGKRFSMHLMVQPIVLDEILSSDILTQQGLLTRCLITWPESTIGKRAYMEQSIYATREYQEYASTMDMILKTPLPFREGTHNELELRQLTLSNDAKRAYIGFHDHIESLMGENKALYPIKGYAAKAAEHALRLAGDFTLIENLRAHEVPVDWVEAGVALTQHYLDEVLRLSHNRLDDPEIVLADQCRVWMQATWKPKHGDLISLPDLYNFGPYGVRSKDKAYQIMRILEEHSWVTPVPGGCEVKGKLRRQVWRMNNESVS